MPKQILAFILFCSLMIFTGCSGAGGTEEIEKAINEAFKTRAELVFKHKDKTPLQDYFSSAAIQQNKDFLEWSPNGQWDNVKDLKYTYSLRIKNLKREGKQATAVVFETTFVNWDYINPEKVVGTQFTKEDAWANRKREVVLQQNAEGRWIIEQDIVR